MKTIIKRAVSLVFVLILVISLAAPAFAASIEPQQGKVDVYASAKTGGYINVPLAYGTKKFTVNRSSVVVKRGTAKAKLQWFSNWCSVQQSAWSGDGGKNWSPTGYRNYQTTVECSIQNPGTAAITYKIGSKSYKISLNILNYRNPIKSITLNSAYNNKNFASKTKNSASVNNLRISTTSKSTLRVKAQTGWLITQAQITDKTNGRNYSLNISQGATGVSIPWGKMYSTHDYQIHLRLINKSNNAALYVNYWN